MSIESLELSLEVELSIYRRYVIAASGSVEANYLQCLPGRSLPCPVEYLGGLESMHKAH